MGQKIESKQTFQLMEINRFFIRFSVWSIILFSDQKRVCEFP